MVTKEALLKSETFFRERLPGPRTVPVLSSNDCELAVIKLPCTFRYAGAANRGRFEAGSRSALCLQTHSCHTYLQG